MTTTYEDHNVLIITNKHGDIQIDSHNKSMKIRCIGHEGWKQQMKTLKGLQRGMLYEDEEQN